MGCIKLSEGVHTAPRPRLRPKQWSMPIGFKHILSVRFLYRCRSRTVRTHHKDRGALWLQPIKIKQKMWLNILYISCQPRSPFCRKKISDKVVVKTNLPNSTSVSFQFPLTCGQLWLLNVLVKNCNQALMWFGVLFIDYI